MLFSIRMIQGGKQW